MVFISSLDIIDTGFLTKNSRTTQVQASDRVNSGSTLRLKGVDLKVTTSANLDKAVTPDNHDIIRDNKGEKHALISINPTTVNITIYISTGSIGIWGSNDPSLLPYLYRLPHTRGFKAIYYPVTGDIRQRDEQLIYQLGSADTTEEQGDIDITLATAETDTSGTSGYDLTNVNYLSVRFESVEIPQVPAKNGIFLKLNGVITG